MRRFRNDSSSQVPALVALGLDGLIALALGLSAHLGWHYLEGESVIGCGAGSAECHSG